MNILNANKKVITMNFLREELLNIHNAFNEVCNGFYISNSDCIRRIGLSKTNLSNLFDKIRELSHTAVKQIKIFRTTHLFNTRKKNFIIEFRHQDLDALVRVINVVIEELESPELETRMGATYEELISLKNQIGVLLEKINTICKD